MKLSSHGNGKLQSLLLLSQKGMLFGVNREIMRDIYTSNSKTETFADCLHLFQIANICICGSRRYYLFHFFVPFKDYKKRTRRSFRSYNRAFQI